MKVMSNNNGTELPARTANAHFNGTSVVLDFGEEGHAEVSDPKKLDELAAVLDSLRYQLAKSQTVGMTFCVYNPYVAAPTSGWILEHREGGQFYDFRVAPPSDRPLVLGEEWGDGDIRFRVVARGKRIAPAPDGRELWVADEVLSLLDVRLDERTGVAR